MSSISTTKTPVHVRVVADQQLFTDVPGVTWMNDCLSYAVEQGDLETFEVLHSITGFMGVQLVTFTVDLWIPGFTDLKKARKWCRKHLNMVIGDTDVSVRFVANI